MRKIRIMLGVLAGVAACLWEIRTLGVAAPLLGKFAPQEWRLTCGKFAPCFDNPVWVAVSLWKTRTLLTDD
jgi:hypothetical protein